MNLWVKILTAIGLGILAGALLGPHAVYLRPIGTLFLSLLNMLIVPLIFTSMTCGIISMPDMKKLGRIGGTAFLLYGVSTLFAIFLGLGIANFLELGSSLHLTAEFIQSPKIPELSDLILSAVPKNPIRAFADGNILQIIIFSIFFGSAINLAGTRAQPVADCMNAINQVMLKMTSVVMAASPFGVFALMAWACGSMGLEVLLPVAQFLLAYYGAAVIHIAVIFCGALWSSGLKALPFFKGTAPAIACAVSTCSSSAALPVSIQCATERLGISKSLANFILPLGCSLNMNGSSLFQAMGAVFIAQAYGVELQFHHFVTLISTVLLATLGTAGVPGGGLIMLSIVFSSIGIPLEGIAILAGVDRLRDMATTALNITGDTVCAVVIAKQENELDEGVYYHEETSSVSEEVL